MYGSRPYTFRSRLNSSMIQKLSRLTDMSWHLMYVAEGQSPPGPFPGVNSQLECQKTDTSLSSLFVLCSCTHKFLFIVWELERPEDVFLAMKVFFDVLVMLLYDVLVNWLKVDLTLLYCGSVWWNSLKENHFLSHSFTVVRGILNEKLIYIRKDCWYYLPIANWLNLRKSEI